jgi:hypothetical protein
LTTSIARSEDVITIKAGEKAPYSGFLFPPEQAADAYKASLERDRLKLLNDSYERSIKIYKENEVYYLDQNKLWMDRANNLAQTVSETREVSTVQKYGIFLLGLAAGLGGAYIATKVIR